MYSQEMLLVVELCIFEEKNKLKKKEFSIFFVTPIIALSSSNKSKENTLWKI